MGVPERSSKAIPNGPATSTADTGTSFFRLLFLVLGRSKKRRDPSGGIDMAAPPTREWLAEDVEKDRAWEGPARAGRRKRGIEPEVETSCTRRRSELFATVQDMLLCSRL